MKLLLAGGGTGGHLIPGLAVAEAVRLRQPDSQFWLFGTPRPIDRQLASAAGVPLTEQTVRPFSTRPWDWPKFYLAWRASCRAARKFIRQERPDVVLGLGGYAAGPAVATAARMNVPNAILNPDAIPGRANLHLARHANRVFCQWDVTVPYLPWPQACRVVGCPVRRGLETLDRHECRRELGLHGGRPLLLVTGASLGAATINNTIPPLLERLAGHCREPWQVLHQTGANKGVMPRLAGKAGETFDYRAVEFIERMDHAIAAADLVIARAGASTLAELTAIGRPAILLPYPFHRDNHQSVNGQVLVDAGAAVMVQDRCDAAANAEALAGPLAELLNDAIKRQRMANAARAIGRPSAADAVTEELLRMI